MIIWANPNILFCDECAVNSDESRDEISGQNSTEYFYLAHQSCTNATLCNFAYFKRTYIKAAAQLRIQMCHYEVIYEGIFLVRQGTLSVLTLEQNIQWAWWKQAWAPGKVRGGAWTLQGDAKKLFIPSAQAENSTDPGVPMQRQESIRKTLKSCFTITRAQ